MIVFLLLVATKNKRWWNDTEIHGFCEKCVTWHTHRLNYRYNNYNNNVYYFQASKCWLCTSSSDPNYIRNTGLQALENTLKMCNFYLHEILSTIQLLYFIRPYDAYRSINKKPIFLKIIITVTRLMIYIYINYLQYLHINKKVNFFLFIFCRLPRSSALVVYTAFEKPLR